MKKSLLLVAVAFAGLATASVSYTVSGGYTGFNGGGASGLVESFTSGVNTFQLAYSITGGSANNTVSTFPSNENFGVFTLSCTAGCDGTAISFPNFTFVITIDDLTDGGIGTFTGTSAGGLVSYNSSSSLGSSNVSVAWSPLQLGPGTNNANSGSFLLTYFTITSPTPIVDPSTNAGATSIQGTINSIAAPEPATFGMMGAALVGLGFIARKRKS